MFIHFENWSAPIFISMLERKGFPHAGKIMKVYATRLDPRELLGRSSLVVLESEHSFFKEDEIFHYKDRESYRGDLLEARMEDLGLGVMGKEVTRALFRFANRQEASFCQAAMAAKLEGRWLFQHPFEDLDGIGKKETEIHLDIFYPTSIERLKNFVEVDNYAQVLSFKEHRLLDQALHSRG